MSARNHRRLWEPDEDKQLREMVEAGRGATMTDSFGAKQRVDHGLEALRVGLSPYVAEKMKQRHGNNWRQYASRAAGGDRHLSAGCR